MRRLAQTKGFTIIGLLIVLAILCVFVYLCLQERPTIPTGSSESMIQEAGIDPATPQSTLQSTQDLIRDIDTEGPDLDKMMDKYLPTTGTVPVK